MDLLFKKRDITFYGVHHFGRIFSAAFFEDFIFNLPFRAEFEELNLPFRAILCILRLPFRAIGDKMSVKQAIWRR